MDAGIIREGIVRALAADNRIASGDRLSDAPALRHMIGHRFLHFSIDSSQAYIHRSHNAFHRDFSSLWLSPSEAS